MHRHVAPKFIWKWNYHPTIVHAIIITCKYLWKYLQNTALINETSKITEVTCMIYIMFCGKIYIRVELELCVLYSYLRYQLLISVNVLTIKGSIKRTPRHFSLQGLSDYYDWNMNQINVIFGIVLVGVVFNVNSEYYEHHPGKCF